MGKVISLKEWGELAEDLNYRIVKQEKVGEYFISTIWLGTDLNFYSEGVENIFETMIFNKEERAELFQQRYRSLEDAKNGHKKIVSMLKDGANIEDLY